MEVLHIARHMRTSSPGELGPQSSALPLRPRSITELHQDDFQGVEGWFGFEGSSVSGLSISLYIYIYIYIYIKLN